MAKLFFDLFEKDDTGTVVQLPIQDIHTSRYQPRVRFDEKAILLAQYEAFFHE